MHWGIRRYQPYPKGDFRNKGYENLKKSKTSNLGEWGKSENSNILFISGYSGSGKSTTSLYLKRKNDEVIHLDAYSEPDSGGSLSIRNKSFDKYLDKKLPNWKKMTNATRTGEDGTIKKYSKEYWDLVDQFRNALESFGKENFKNGNKVIVEGLQIQDDWLSDNKKYYSNKPIVILSTNKISSIKRAFERDEKSLISILKDVDNMKEYISWYKDMNRKMDDLSSISNAKKGKKIINQILRDLK